MQSFNLPFKISDIDFDNIEYTNIKSNSKKTVVFLKYRKKNLLKTLAIQTPTFLNINNPVKSSNNNSSDLDIPLYGKKEDKVDEFVNFLKELDNKIIYDAKINSSSWFNNFQSDEINYQRLIRVSDNKKYENGMIRVKILNNEDFSTSIQLNNQTKISSDEIPKNSWVKMILEIHAIWINQNGFGLFLKPILISFIPIEIKKYKFLEDSEDEVDDIIDSENSVFLKSKIQPNESSETSVLKLESSNKEPLDINNKRFSSTSSEDMKRKSEELDANSNNEKV